MVVVVVVELALSDLQDPVLILRFDDGLSADSRESRVSLRSVPTEHNSVE